MTIGNAMRLACGVAVFARVCTRPLPAQIEIGTWVRQSPASTSAVTMTVEACCNGGRRLICQIAMAGTKMELTLEPLLDGRDGPVLVNGKPSGETMAITRVDSHRASTIVKMNGKPLGTSKSTLSADGKTMTVLNDFSSSAGGQAVGKSTDIWVRK